MPIFAVLLVYHQASRAAARGRARAAMAALDGHALADLGINAMDVEFRAETMIGSNRRRRTRTLPIEAPPPYQGTETIERPGDKAHPRPRSFDVTFKGEHS